MVDGDDVIAGLDGENGLMRPEGIVELFGLEVVSFSEGDASERYCQYGAKERFHKRLYYGASARGVRGAPPKTATTVTFPRLVASYIARAAVGRHEHGDKHEHEYH